MYSNFNNNPLFQDQFNNQNINQGYNTNKNIDVWPSIDYRTNIDSNGYARGEYTSAGCCPNTYLLTPKPGGMIIYGTINTLGQLNQQTPICGTINNGYYTPNNPF